MPSEFIEQSAIDGMPDARHHRRRHEADQARDLEINGAAETLGGATAAHHNHEVHDRA